jgi:outer membrane protein assembly factor BamB
MMNMFQNKAKLIVIVMAAALMAIGTLCLSEAYAQVKPSGAAAAKPVSTSSAKVVGWRGDGTGRYPGATPPTEWYLKESGESKNILWKTKLPCYTWSTPIIVGDKIFTRSEPYDLVCLNKNTGKPLWIRSYPPIIGLTAEEKKAKPALKQIDSLAADLQKLNDEFVARGWSKELYARKHDLQAKINDLSAKADDKLTLPPDMYVESWTGYTAATPCSDGKFVYFTSGDGVTACYDLDGNLKWAHYNQITGNAWGEHGQACSPTVAGDKLLVSTPAMMALNKATGAQAWPLASGGGGWAILPLTIGGTDYAVMGGNYVRASDGKVMIPRTGDMPGGFNVINDNMVFYGGSHQSFYRLGTKPDGGLSLTPLITEEYNRVKLPTGDNPKLNVDKSISGFVTASPLYNDGLLYTISNFGKLFVLDTTKTKQSDTLVYSSFPPFDFKNGYSRKSTGMGIGASPAFAGKYIYMIDSANCMIVMAPGREYKQIAKNTIDCTVPDWETRYYAGSHHEQTEASPIFDGSRIYIRGEQFLYCVGTKG